MTNAWVCMECGNRQAELAGCQRCGNDEVLDARKDQVKDLMADFDQRRSDARASQLRWGAVVIAVGVVVILWTIPAYRAARGPVYPGLPFFADQWGFMIVLGFALLKLGERVLAYKPRFAAHD